MQDARQKGSGGQKRWHSTQVPHLGSNDRPKALEEELDQLKEQIDGCERRVDSTEAGEAPFKVIDNEFKNW